MNDTTETEKAKRPVAITIICILGFLGAIVAVPLIFSGAVASIGDWYPPYFGLIALIDLVCMVGLWMMRKWAAYTYTGMELANQIVLVAMGVWNIIALAIPAIVVAIALSNLKKMT